MKYLLIILLSFTLGCSKEERTINITNNNIECSNSEVYLYIYGDVRAVNGCSFIIYEDKGNGFEISKELYYSTMPLNIGFTYKVEHPFYFYTELHNTSLLLSESKDKGLIGINVEFNDVLIKNIECDTVTRSITFTSPIYNK